MPVWNNLPRIDENAYLNDIYYRLAATTDDPPFDKELYRAIDPNFGECMRCSQFVLCMLCAQKTPPQEALPYYQAAYESGNCEWQRAKRWNPGFRIGRQKTSAEIRAAVLANKRDEFSISFRTWIGSIG